MDFKNKYQKRNESNKISSWFFMGGGSGGDNRVVGEYRDLTSLSLKSRAFFLQAYHYERIISHEFI